MKSKLKNIGKKLLVVMMAGLMLLGSTPMMKQAFAETQHNDVFTDIKLTKADLETPVGSIGYGQQMQLVAKFSLPNNKVHEGDKTVLPLPKELEIFKKETFPIKNEKGDIIANAVTDPNTKTVTMTYTNYVDSHSDITGSLHVTVMVDSNVVKTPKKLHLKVTMGNGTVFDLGELDYTGVQGDNPDESLMKWSSFDKDDPTTVHCNIRVNGKGGNFPYIKVTDTLETPSVSYIKGSVEVKKGKWKLPAGGGYYSLENETDVTNQYPLNFNNNSFTVQFNNIKGEGYLIKYDVKLGYVPVNQEKIKNRILGETNSQILIDTVNVALYQQSGGEANGYNYTIKIHKESEDGHKLEGAVFEVIRDSSHAKVGEITTDSDGNGSLGGLLKDNYTIRETKAPKGYMPLTETIKVTPADFGTDKAVLKNIKNKPIPKINICGEKTWDDGNNQDGKRPSEITVNLLANGEPIQNKDVRPDATGKWKYRFENLPKYDDQGKEIKYTITEDAVTEYTAEINGFNIKNSYTPHKTSVTVTKKWDDANNQDGKRPNSIKVQLYGDDDKVGPEIELTPATWSYTWNNLPEKKAGKTIKYTVKEVGSVSGYTTSYDDQNSQNITITNKHVPEKIKIEGQKTWDDANDQDGKRPKEITVNLLKNGAPFKSVTVKPNPTGEWKYEFTNLDKYESGKLIKYTITENAVKDYNFSNDGYNIKNSYTPKETSVTVTKRWNDSNDKDKIRPESIKVQLYANGEKKGDAVELKAENSWSYTWNNLPEKENGKDIKYTVKEVGKLKGYTVSVDDKDHGNVIITNTHIPKEITNPKTGDINRLIPYMAILLLSVMAFAGIMVARRRTRN